MITIKDLAKASEFAVSTISMVLNDRENIGIIIPDQSMGFKWVKD